MGGGQKEVSGPDLTKGVAFASLEPGKPVLGHAAGEAVVVVRLGDDVCAIGASCTHYAVATIGRDAVSLGVEAAMERGDDAAIERLLQI